MKEKFGEDLIPFVIYGSIARGFFREVLDRLRRRLKELGGKACKVG